jgi:hypothetical protein
MAALAVAMAGACFAQNNAEPPKYYKLDFTVKELEAGKTVNARNYSTIGATKRGSQSIRANSKVPSSTSPGSTQFTYVDVGVNIDVNSVEEIAGELSLFVSADITSVLQDGQATVPVIRSNRWMANVVVPMRKPVVICSSDDATGKRQMQLELTATPIRTTAP